MRRSFVAVVAALLGLTFSVPVAQAVGPTLLFTVPGVVSVGDLGTFFLCTSTATTNQMVSVQFLDRTGNPGGNGSFDLPPNNTVMFGTRNPAGLLVDVDMASPGIGKGSAQISSTSKKLICSAFIADSTNATLTFGTSLNVLAKQKQKGV
ncbi:MAG: hypothetical protein HY271_11675 [Deltaproteobacteria bacterium]|nr:hypothetical protein [Deltaproteobacteria bacterium]